MAKSPQWLDADEKRLDDVLVPSAGRRAFELVCNRSNREVLREFKRALEKLQEPLHPLVLREIAHLKLLLRGEVYNRLEERHQPMVRKLQYYLGKTALGYESGPNALVKRLEVDEAVSRLIEEILTKMRKPAVVTVFPPRTRKPPP